MCNLIISNPCKFMFFFSYRFSVNNPFLYFYFFIFFLGGGGEISITSLQSLRFWNVDRLLHVINISYHNIWGTRHCRLHSQSFHHTGIPGVHRFRRHTYADPEDSREWWCLYIQKQCHII